MSREMQDFLIFRIGEESLGLRLSEVEEVLPKSSTTPIPQTANFVRGVAAIRGRVMSVIDGGLRLGIPSMYDAHFIVCKVRGNLTAVTIEKPLEAGTMWVEKLSDFAAQDYLKKRGLPARLFSGVWQICRQNEFKEVQATGNYFAELNADQLVSDRMASQIGSVAG